MVTGPMQSTDNQRLVACRAEQLLRENQRDIYSRTDRLFAWLMGIQWIAGIVIAVLVSPRSWAGPVSTTHIHLWAAVFLGGAISLFPIALAIFLPGKRLTRHVIAISQMLTSALWIHLSGGRIETHFHVFGSLAFVACYRDWRVLFTASLVVVLDHFARGVYFPESVFGVSSASQWRVLEHGGWVLFEDVFLAITIAQSIGEMKAMARQRAELEATNDLVEAEVKHRTMDLESANELILHKNATLRHQAEELGLQAVELKRAKQQYVELSAFGQILDRSLNEIYIFGTETLLFTRVNRGARENVGYSMDELCQLTPIDLSPEFTREAFEEKVAPLLDGSEEYLGFRTVHRRKDGSKYPVDVHLEASILGDTSVFVAIIGDITEQWKKDEELRESRAMALAADQAKTEFLANMSHEIRTPMTAILGFTGILLGRLSDERDIDAAETILRNGEYLLQLINNILDLSKIEAGKLEVEQLTCSPQQIVGEVADLMRPRATAKGLCLEVEADEPVPDAICSDPTRLRQILINVLGNAIKFTQTGSVLLKTHFASRDETMLQFDVIDTGIGIAGDRISGLFEPFTQADGSMTRQFGGTGLGLAITKRLVEILGGEVEVSSTVGQGTTFSVRIPTGDVDGKAPPDEYIAVPIESNSKSAQETAIRLDQYRVLLAEDGLDNQRLIRLLLTRAGAEVIVAENGEIAVKHALEAVEAGNPFDVVLMDMQMPVLDGYDAARRLRIEGYGRPIVALTAHAMSTDGQKCLDAGCDGYETKPIQPRRLIQIVRDFAQVGMS